MKNVCIVVFLFLSSMSPQTQEAGTIISSGLTTAKFLQPYKRDGSLFADSGTAAAQSMPSDTVLYNMYGNLREDNPEYNENSPLWSCALGVVLNNVSTWVYDRYLFNSDHARIGLGSWKRNIATGPIWDTDRFGMNFFFRPYSGIGYFHSARADGYGFYESVPFTFGGSLMWEYLGENTLPSVNDLVNTTVTGAFLGEISYRLSSNVLDDRTTGSERVLRELFAGIIDPPRAFSRLLQGKLSRVTSEEIYQKEPLTMTFSAGPRLVNDGRSFGTGSISEVLTLDVDYGDPFEQLVYFSDRHPRDFPEIHDIRTEQKMFLQFSI
ncbi:MAG: hypothetical protein HW389_3284, partial [Bacteroidetes bacterium]|nr:hypothetical protein [Bacteroidota bacterium]